MDKLVIISLLVSPAFGASWGECDGIDAKNVIPYQHFVCDYKAEDPHHDIKNYGGEYRLSSDNKTVNCSVSNSAEILSCGAIVRYINGTDEYGNVNREIYVSSQGCWLLQCMVEYPCEVADECVTTEAKDPFKAAFCCCRKDQCNKEATVKLLPYIDDSTTVARVHSTKAARNPKMSATTTTIVISVSLLLLLVVAATTIFLCYKRRRAHSVIQTDSYQQLEHRELTVT